MTARRWLSVAAAATLVGGALMLLAGGRPWAVATVHQPSPLPATRLRLTGADLGGIVRALGLLALAGVAGILATRGRGRAVVGALLLATGVGAVLSLGLAAPAQVRGSGAVQARVDTGASVTVRREPAWPAAYVLGGVLVGGAGLLTVVRGRHWPGMGARYEAPTPTRTPAADPWAAIDRGEDPTLR